jgi:hypothetical protein
MAPTQLATTTFEDGSDCPLLPFPIQQQLLDEVLVRS